MRFGRRLAGLALAVSMLAAVRAEAQPVADDLFTGATIVSSTSGTVHPEAMFDGSDVDPNQVTFFPSDRGGAESEVVFGTPVLVVTGIRLHAATDGSELLFRRSMSRFRFFADTDGDGTASEQLVDHAVDVDYDSGHAGDLDTAPNELELAFTFGTPVTAARWRVVVTQGVSFGEFDGVRVEEIDAVAVPANGSQSQSPTPTPTTTSPSTGPDAPGGLGTTSPSGLLARTGSAGTEPWGLLLLLAGGGLWLLRSAARRQRRSAP